MSSSEIAYIQPVTKPVPPPRPRETYVPRLPADGRYRASCATDSAVSRQATTDTIVARVSAPPARFAPMIATVAMPPAGAIWEIDWNSTAPLLSLPWLSSSGTVVAWAMAPPRHGHHPPGPGVTLAEAAGVSPRPS